jgi:hypothetical protein
MRILVDSLSSQVQVQLQGAPPHRRLNTLYGAMLSAGASLTKRWGGDQKDPEWQICFSVGPITEDQLEGCDVFFVMTHHLSHDVPSPAYVWTPSELDAITHFVANGGGLLLMTNHADYQQYDAALAARFGIVLHEDFISNKATYMVMSGDLLNKEAFAKTYLFAVDSLATHDSCGISFAPGADGKGTWIAKFPAAAVDRATREAPDPGRYYSVLMPWQKGKVIVIGNSGTVGDSGGTPFPACGMVTYGNNLMFVLNCLRLLGGQPQAGSLGACPGGTG